MPGRPVVPLNAEHAANFIEGQPELDTEGFYVEEDASAWDGEGERAEFVSGPAGDRSSPAAADDMYVAHCEYSSCRGVDSIQDLVV